MSIYAPYISDSDQLEYLFNHCRGEMKYTLMNDFLSKYGFQKDLYALRGLLAALLRIDIEDITDIKILNPIEPGGNITEKECILDINLELNNTKVINIEIQARYQDFWPERSIIYLCRNFDKLKVGESYKNIKPSIHIGILSHDLFDDEDPRYTGDFYSEYRLLHTTKHTEYSGKFEIRVLSLNQLENASDEDKNNPNGLYHWARMFRASSWEELKMIAQDNPAMTSFVGTVMQLTAEEKIAQMCEARRRYSNDIATYEYEIATNKAALKESEEALKESEEALKESEEALKESKEALKESKEALKESEAALAENRIKLEKVEHEKIDAVNRLNDTRDELADANAEIVRLKKQILEMKKQ